MSQFEANSEVYLTDDGTHSVRSGRFGESYHSTHGAWQETQHVFINAGLAALASATGPVHILDIGYGTGLNCLATIVYAHEQDVKVHYVAVEAYPLDSSTVALLNYPTQIGLSTKLTELHAQMQGLAYPGTAQLLLKPDLAFSLEKRLQHIENVSDVGAFDLIYFDAFAPDAQPNLWTPAVFEAMYTALRVAGVLVTYCAKGQVRRDLQSCGFTVERLPGPPGKREMLRATKV